MIMQNAQQHVQHLQQLSTQLQQLATAVQQAIPPVSQPAPGEEDAAWASSLRDQAKQAAAALQQHVQAGACAPSRQLLCAPPSQLHNHLHTHSGQQQLGQVWSDLLQRVLAAAPQLQLHLFLSTGNKLLCSQPAAKPLSAEYIASICAYVDEVRVVVKGVLVAAIALSGPGRLQPVRVCVDSADRASTVDPWTHSKHQVFKRISLLAVRALLHFQQVEAGHALLTPPGGGGVTAGSSSSSSAGGSGQAAEGVALECLLLWLASYDDLFVRACDISGRVLTWAPATAVPLPPLVRPYWLSVQGLRDAASNRDARKAYHTHLAPWPKGTVREQEAVFAAADVAAAEAAASNNTGRAAAQPPAPAAALAGQAGPPAGVSAAVAGSHGGPAAMELAPWDTAEFTDDELRAQLRHVIGDVF